MSSDIVETVLEKKGRNIYKNNEHMRNLATVMSHPEFRSFYDKYLTDWESTKMIIMFMRLYESIEKHSKIELSPYQKLSIIQDVIDDPELRQKICKEWNENFEKSKNFLPILPQE